MIRFTNVQVLHDGGFAEGDVTVAEGHLADSQTKAREVDLGGALVLPGIVDLHGDGFERHMAPRRGAMTDAEQGIIATEAELAANGITTAVLAQFYSWEGGMRSPDFAEHVFRLIDQVGPSLGTDMRPQLRLEHYMVDDYPRALEMIDRFGIPYVVLNDHLQHDRLAIGARPKRLTGQALKAGRNPDDHFTYMVGLHQNGARLDPALDRFCAELRSRGVRIGSHDDNAPTLQAAWRGRGVTISEFPETRAAAQEAKANGTAVVLGAPNVMRGGSHKGNVSAADLVADGLCDALASDYHYPSLRHAILKLETEGAGRLEALWPLISAHPARILGLEDRGRLQPGLRADLVVLNADTNRLEATLSGGRFTYLTGDCAARICQAG